MVIGDMLKRKVFLLKRVITKGSKILECAEWLSKYSSIKTCTFYAFSIKNFDRSKTS